MTPRISSRPAVVVALALTGLVALGPVPAASAHDPVTTSVPADGAVLTETPEAFSVTAAQPMLDLTGGAAGFGLQVTDAAGRYYGDGCVTVDVDTLSMPATLGEPGDYTMTYQYVSSDGHTTSDTIDFSVAPTAATTGQVGSASPPVCSQTEGVASPDVEPTPTTTDAAPDTSNAEPSADPTSADESAIVFGIVAGILVGLTALAVIATIMVRRGRRHVSDPDAGGASDGGTSN